MSIAELTEQTSRYKLLPEVERLTFIRALVDDAESFVAFSRDTIEKVPGVCGGAAVVRGTRVPVWYLVQCWNAGWTDAMILEQLPALTAMQVAAAYLYSRVHRAEIVEDIRRNTFQDDTEDDLADRVIRRVNLGE